MSLTPQTIRRFRSRFPRVAVLHSHLSDSERHAHWRSIANGEVDVVVELSDFDAVVLDPARSGAEAQSRQLANSRMGTVVSCSPAIQGRWRGTRASSSMAAMNSKALRRSISSYTRATWKTVSRVDVP